MSISVKSFVAANAFILLLFFSPHASAQLSQPSSVDPWQSTSSNVGWTFSEDDTSSDSRSSVASYADAMELVSCSCDASGMGCGSEVGCGCGVASHPASCLTRTQLLGDMLGVRPCLAEHGIIYQASITQFYQGVTSGGAEQVFRYGNKIDQYFIFDSEKLGLWKGAKLIMHAESAMGQSSIFDAAAMAPANTAFLTPRPTDLPVTAITNLQLEQELPGGYAITAGRFNFIDLWAQFYPDYGKGRDGFMNINSIIFMNVVPTLPIVFNGGGVIKAGEKGIEAALLVLDPDNIPTVSGLNGELFDDGSTILGAYRVFTEFGGLPGSHLVAGTYSNRTYTSYDGGGWSFHPGTGVSAGQQTGSWLGAYVGEQNLWMDSHDKHRRVFFMTTMGWADSKTSPYEWMGTFSVEALGFNERRKQDRMGIGYFYSDVSDDLENLVPAPVGLQDLQGGEIYYNMAITPWFHLTADLQAIQTEIDSQDTAIVFGLRAKMDL